MREDLRSAYRARLPILEGLARTLQHETSEALASTPHIDRIAFRVKGVESFLAKAERNARTPYENPLNEIEDQIAGRIIVFFRDDIEVVNQKLRGTFNPIEGLLKRHDKRDDAFGYESFHLICVIPRQVVPSGWDQLEDAPNTFELQIRTIFMHAYSEPQHEFAYKAAEDLPGDVRRELAWIAASAWGADQAYQRVLAWARRNSVLPTAPETDHTSRSGEFPGPS